MATFRVGVGSFNIQDGAVGFGTDTDGLGNLKVKGVTKTTDIKVSGASTLTRYAGFAADNIDQLQNITLTSTETIGDIVVGVGTSVIISSASTVTVGTVESVSIGTHFSPPKGGIEERGQDFVEGMMRYNTDFNTMEFYNGNEWRQFTHRQDLKNSPTSMGRGLISGYFITEFVQVSTQGNSIDFGRLTNSLYGSASASSSTRGMVMGGWGPTPGSPGQDLDVEYITMASTGDAIDFGSDNSGGWGSQGASDSVRALSAGGGYPSATTDIDMFFFSTVGSHIDYADITAGRNRGTRGMCNPVRAVFTGTYGPDSTKMDTKLIANSANTTDFGDMYFGLRGHSCCSDTTRGVAGGGNHSPIASPGYLGSHSLEFITISSTGTSQYFGDLYKREIGFRGAAQNMTRGLWAGGAPASVDNGVDSIIIQTTGNAVDWGDLSSGATNQSMGLNDSHGGVGGY